MSSLLTILALIGAIYGAALVIKFIRFTVFWTRTGSLDRYNYKQENQSPWALVTGSSDGIGLGFAQELAKFGFSIVLHGRNPTKLEAAKKTILSESPNVQVRYVVLDVCTPGEKLLVKIQEIVEELKDLHLIVLINNVGGLPPNMDPVYKVFDKAVAWEIDDCIAMNIRFTCHLTSLLLARFTKMSRPALVINISSAADLGLPYIATYSGCKGYIDSWSLALSREMQADKKDIEIMCIRPLKVTNTSFTQEKSNWSVPGSRTFAKAALSRVGGGRAYTEGILSHRIVGLVMGSLPERFLVNAMKEEVEKEKAQKKKE